MRRVAVQAFRTARRGHVRRVLSSRKSPLLSSHYASSSRSVSSPSSKGQTLPVLRSSMYFRPLVALASSLVAFGAWYTYRNPVNPQTGALASNYSTTSTALSRSPAVQQGSLKSTEVHLRPPQSSTDSATAEEAEESTRRALVVENDQFYTGDLVGDAPLSKTTDDAGQKVLEMLTPDQATLKLRRNEESYLVGRGRGVVRYDVVQLPSNDPIEDDHAEKIVEIPQSVTATRDGSSSFDWMFWGVFDGHRSVRCINNITSSADDNAVDGQLLQNCGKRSYHLLHEN